MGTKGSFQLRLISFPLPEAEKNRAFGTSAEGPKAAFRPGFGAGKMASSPLALSSDQPRVKTWVEGIWCVCFGCAVLSRSRSLKDQCFPLRWEERGGTAGTREWLSSLFAIRAAQPMRRLPSKWDKSRVLGKLGLAQSCLCRHSMSLLGLVVDRAGCGTSSQDPSTGSMSLLAWHKPWD